MDIAYYRYFLVIADCRSITQAAEKLFVSQPYLSKVLAALEKEMGKTLIDRSHIPIRLTPEGECMQYYAREILRLDHEMRHEISFPQEDKMSVFEIGTPHFIASHVMPDVIRKMTGLFPHTFFSLYSNSLISLIERLQAGNLSAVFAMWAEPMKGMNVVPVVQDRELLTIPPGHPLYRPERAGRISDPWFSMDQLSGDEFVMFSGNSIRRERQDIVLASLGIRPRIILETDNTEIAAFYSRKASSLAHIFTTDTTAAAIPEYKSMDYVFLGHPLNFHTLSLAYQRENPYIQPLIRIIQEVYSSQHLPEYREV